MGDGFACGLILNIFYQAVKHEWPANYFEIDSSADPIISRKFPRYMAFRFAPPALLFVAAAETAQRSGSLPWLASASALAMHSSGLIKGVIHSLRLRRNRLAFGRVLVLLFLTVIAFIAVLTHHTFAFLVPSPRELVANFWAGALAAVGAVYLQRVALVKRDPLTVARTATSKIEHSLIRYARFQAAAAGVEESLVLIFLVAEDIQRPRWYRWFESRVPGSHRRTTGIMQQRGARSDEQSIDLAIDSFFLPITSTVKKEYTSRGIEGDETLMRQEIFDRTVERFSEDPRFRGFVRGLYCNLYDDKEWRRLIDR